jgi:16S rRNA (cytosine967-C5)-methyltransferase
LIGATTSNPRLAALKMLGSVLDNGANLSDADSENRQSNPKDRAFSRHISYGVLRWLTALEWLSAHLLRKPLRRKDRDIHRLILIGLYQLWKDESAQHAAVNESAECARKLGKPWAVSVINAVLRRFQREQNNILETLSLQEERYAHPPWLLDALKKDWPDEWERIVHANQQAGGLWLRLNACFDAQDTLEMLASGGFAYENHPWLEHAVRIIDPVPVSLLPGFSQGRFSVQDPAAQLAAGLLQPEEGHRVLDACAAPGGKTGHILERYPGVKLFVLDQSEARLARVKENLGRLGLQKRSNPQLAVADAANPGTWWDGNPFDRILLDAPCSATGVIRRHPEIKWLRTPEQVRQASLIQQQLLAGLWPLLKPEGILVYATCSVLRLENNRQIQAFVETNADACEEPFDVSWGKKQNFGHQVFPGDQDMDGFYYACLRKNS